MKIPQPSDRTWDDLDPQLCEEGLDFLAYVLREDEAADRALDASELTNIRAVATDLLIGVASWLGRPAFGFQEAPEPENRAARLFHAIRAAASPESSRKELADAFQSIADLLRASRRLDVVGRSNGVN